MNNIYVTQPTLAPLEEVTQLLEKIWSSGVMTHNGPLVQQFEKEFCIAEHLPDMVAVCNGTIAIQMAIRALQIEGEIITTPFSFIATLDAILWEGAKPVFVDIDPETFNMDPDLIEAAITPATRAILPVHVFGNSCKMDRIEEIARKYKLKVIYDAAHSVGSTYRGEPVLNRGDISTTSFHATKMLNTSEGGGCFTKDPETFRRLQMIRFFGYNSEKDIEIKGLNGKMTEVNAAIGLANLKYLPQALTDRKTKYNLYKQTLSCNEKLRFQKIDKGCNCSYFPLVFRNEATLHKVEKALAAEKVFARQYFHPSLNTYTKLVDYVSMPESESLADRILCLPLYFKLSQQDILRICDIILETMK
jgi:dTDP-4-amino-4,6-dideoxygalactose transaminase